MSKEIIIKSPIKILTERSNCTQLNDGEIGIYQPPYRYKNEDGTLGDFKCKKVQIYTKINGEIRKTNTYKPTGIIHHKPIPFDARVGEIYYSDTFFFRKTLKKGESVSVHLPYIEPSLYDTMSVILDTPMVKNSILEDFLYKNFNGVYHIKYVSVNNSLYDFLITDTLDSYRLEIKFRLPRGYYYSFVNNGTGKMLTKVLNPPINARHSMRGIVVRRYRKKRKILFNWHGKPVDFGKPYKLYRYAIEGNPGANYGLCADFYCKKRRNKKWVGRELKRLSMPPIYYRVPKSGGVRIPISPTK